MSVWKRLFWWSMVAAGVSYAYAATTWPADPSRMTWVWTNTGVATYLILWAGLSLGWDKIHITLARTTDTGSPEQGEQKDG